MPPKDAHVLAAAVHDRADALVTFNLKDFLAESTEPLGIEVLHPDEFLLQLLNHARAAVIYALQAGIEDLRRPPLTINDWLSELAATVPIFATRGSAAIDE